MGPKEIQSYQVKTMHYSDIAYHFIIDNDGRVWQGRLLEYMGAHAGRDSLADIMAARIRHGILDQPPESALVRDPDWGQAGICLCGNFSHQQPRKQQLDALKTLLICLCDSLELSPGQIALHREINPNTTCPGDSAAGIISDLINEICDQYYHK